MIPILGSYTEVVKTFNDLRKRSDKFQRGEVDWPLVLKAMTTPSSDKIFSMRASRRVPLASAIIGKHLERGFSVLKEVYDFPCTFCPKFSVVTESSPA